MPGEIRQARAEDADAIAALHILNWRDTYRGTLPDSFLDEKIVAERRAAWARFFSEPRPGAIAFLAFDPEGELEGFIALERGQEAGYDAVIENLHVAPKARGGGLGKTLMGTAAAYLIDRGAGSVCLWVYDDNTPAIDFYIALGGTVDAHGIDSFARAEAPHSRIGWHDLAALCERCA